MPPQSERLVWIDLEMTGLDTGRDHIIEIATIVTDSQLEVVAEGPVIAVHQPESVLGTMDEWNRRTHGESGLIERVRKSTASARDAESRTLEFLQAHAQQGASPMCGNSVCQDRRFLAREMPELEAFFHYRNLDVSTLKELARRWAPDVLASLQKSSRHLALDDIRESIEELRHYRRLMFRSTEHC
jgi:oligoribonuclease